MNKRSDDRLKKANRLKQIDYWVDSAIHDLDVAETLFKNGKYDGRKFSAHKGDLPMPSEKNKAINKAKTFIKLLKKNGINVYEAYMFGSAAMDRADEYSDIDIAIVSDSFAGIPFYDVKKISKFRRAVDLRLEVHPFSLDEIRVDPPAFFIDIKREGFQI